MHLAYCVLTASFIFPLKGNFFPFTPINHSILYLEISLIIMQNYVMLEVEEYLQLTICNPLFLKVKKLSANICYNHLSIVILPDLLFSLTCVCIVLFKCKIQWYLMNSQSFATIITICFQEIFIIPQKKPSPYSSHSILPASSGPGNH